jgi:hypothetical protein
LESIEEISSIAYCPFVFHSSAIILNIYKELMHNIYKKFKKIKERNFAKDTSKYVFSAYIPSAQFSWY